MQLEKLQDRIPGVAIAVTLDGKPRLLAADGTILGANGPDNGSKFLLTLNVDRKADVMVAQVGRPNSKVKDVRVWTPRRGDESTVSYDLVVEVKKSDAYGCLVTHYPGNYLAVVVLDSQGSFDFWEVAIVSQVGQFFVTTQKKYSARLYRDGRFAVCPQFKGWPELDAVLAERDQVKKYKLASVAEYKAGSKPATKELTDGTAEVLFWDAAKGGGGLRTTRGDTYAEVNQVPARPRLRYLTAGEVVKVANLRTGKGAFPFIAEDISLV